MQVTYARKVDHCSKSNYVKTVTVKEIMPVANADALDVVKFEEAGWQVVVKKGTVKVGDKHFFLPPESVLPLELSDALEVTKYLQRGKIKVIKLRGEFSEGLLADEAKCKPYLDYILQWEDLPAIEMQGTPERKREKELSNGKFPVFYKIPNLMNDLSILTEGEEVWVTEKIHGTNCRFGYVEDPKTHQRKLFVGSHNVILKNPFEKPSVWARFKAWITGKKIYQAKPNVYWNVVSQVVKDKKLPDDVVFFGEIYGDGVQDMDYDVPKNALKIRVFATYQNFKYNTFYTTQELCNQLGFETVPKQRYTYKGIEDAIELSRQPSELTKKHIREGVVIQDINEPMKWAKVVSPEYLARKGKTTERH